MARAYHEFESAGLVATGSRNGTVVATVAVVSRAVRRSRLRDAGDAFVRVARQFGAAGDETLATLARAGLAPAPADA